MKEFRIADLMLALWFALLFGTFFWFAGGLFLF